MTWLLSRHWLAIITRGFLVNFPIATLFQLFADSTTNTIVVQCSIGVFCTREKLHQEGPYR